MATIIATGHDSNGGYVTYPSDNNTVAYLWDGSLLVLADDEPSLILYQIASPGGGTPTATTVKSLAVASATSGSIQTGDLFVADNDAGGNDVWIAYGENGNVGGSDIIHGTYSSSGTWTWDSAASLEFNASTASVVDMACVVWTGTYLIVGRRCDISGSIEFAINYTTDKTGATGWQANLIRLSGSFGGSSHYFGTLMHDATLGATVAVYSINGDTLQSRVLPDSSTPALANWGSEVALGTGTLSQDDFQGPACCLDHTTGRVHVAYHTGAGTGVNNIGYVTGTVSVNGTSSAVTWGTPLAVGTQSIGTNASPTLGVDGSGKVFVFWATHYIGNSAALIKYATISSPYTSASAETTLTGTGCNSPQIPKRARFTKGYVPLVYTQGTASPYNVYYDNSIAASSGGSSVTGAASWSVNGNLTALAAVLWAAAGSFAADGNLSALASVLWAGADSLAADWNLSATAAKAAPGAGSFAADLNLVPAAIMTYKGASTLQAQANLAALAVALFAVAISLASQANLTADGLDSSGTIKVPTAVILLQLGLAVIEVLVTTPTAVIVLNSEQQGTLT